MAQQSTMTKCHTGLRYRLTISKAELRFAETQHILARLVRKVNSKAYLLMTNESQILDKDLIIAFSMLRISPMLS